MIPINFFLFNRGPSETSLLAVDELVFQAVEQPHSLVFNTETSQAEEGALPESQTMLVVA
jgi:hypothetical protein